MSENVNFLSAVGAVIVSLVLGIAVGIWLGYRLGKIAGFNRNQVLSLRVERLLRELAWYSKLGDRIAVHAQRVSKLSSAHAIPGDVAVAIHELLLTIRGLNQQLRETEIDLRSSQPARVKSTNSDTALDTEGPAVEDRSALSTTEIGTLTEVEQRQVESDKGSDRRRYPYDCLQRLLKWEDPDASPPDPADSVVVRCRDISKQGISFLWPDEPDFEHVLISLGSGADLTFMSAKVVHSNPVYMHGEWQCAVSCRFTGRMREFTEQWKRHASDFAESAPQGEPTLVA